MNNKLYSHSLLFKNSHGLLFHHVLKKRFQKSAYWNCTMSLLIMSLLITWTPALQSYDFMLYRILCFAHFSNNPCFMPFTKSKTTFCWLCYSLSHFLKKLCKRYYRIIKCIREKDYYLFKIAMTSQDHDRSPGSVKVGLLFEILLCYYEMLL